ncbi:response regulator [Pseudonocardia humida]|uniref:Response regulator transcription factor n=1 Tax=Pseudonocardia humida TaxID=2800819 RepID=A0ABT1A0L2_9PSEU|nr:response regulator transcription factor [Pseudonocardia humida]MCO1656527.1 response regulator transcription factor [Pseudonocardia humida]
MAERVRVLLADDDPALRATLRLLLEATPGMAVVGEAGDGREAVELVAALAPDVVLMDVRMPRLDGVEATRRIVGSGAAARVLVLTTFDLDEHVHAALRAGAAGFLLKDAPPARLLDAVRVVAAGEALLAPTVTRRLIARFTRGADRAALAGVTPRERDVLVLITEGLSNAEIQQRLRLSRGTVKTHIGRLMSKLGARDRAQLVIAGYRAGLGDP